MSGGGGGIRSDRTFFVSKLALLHELMDKCNHRLYAFYHTHIALREAADGKEIAPDHEPHCRYRRSIRRRGGCPHSGGSEYADDR